MKVRMKKVISVFLSVVMLISIMGTVDLSVYADSANPSESKQYQMFKADYYSKNFNFSTPSFAREYYDEMKNDTAFMTFLATWEVAHIATSPSHAMESGMITLKEYYKTVLFDLFAQSNSESGLTDQLLKMVKNSELSYIVSVTKTISKPLSEISQDNISYEGLSKISAQDAADAIKKSGLYQGTEMYGIVTKIAGWAKDAKSLVEAFSKYLAIADLNDGTKEILNIIANDSQNPNELREAAADCVSYFGEGYEKVLNQILAGTWDITVGVFDTVADVALDWAWGMIIGSITTATGGAIGSAVLLGAKGIRVFSNFLFNVDKDVESFYQIKAAVVCEDAMKRVIANINNQGNLSSSFELSNLYNQAVEAFEKTVLLGFDYSIGLLKNSAEAPAIKYTNLLFGKYDECMDLISQISGFKNDKIQIFSRFEDKCLNAFKKEYCLDFDDVIYGLEHQNIPIDAIELTQIKDFTVGLTNECMFNYVKAEFLPEAHTEIAFESWRSSDNSVIEIVNDTSFTVHKEGSCTLTCYLSSGVSADITVTVGENQGGYKYDYNHFEFKFNDNDLTAEITGYTGSASRLAIPSKIGKYTVTSIGVGAFDSCAFLEYISLPNSLNYIGDGAFARSGIKRIIFPDSLRSVGEAVFYQCDQLEYVDLGEGISSLESKDLNGHQMLIPQGFFGYCTSLKKIIFPNRPIYIDTFTFRACDKLEDITVSVSEVEGGAFYDCGAKNISIRYCNRAHLFLWYYEGFGPDRSLKYGMFESCSNLESLYLPNNISDLKSEYAFHGCTNLKDIYYNGSQESWNKEYFSSIGNDVLQNVTMHFCGHMNKELVRMDDATCAQEGSIVYKCLSCNEEIIQRISITEHIYDDGVITTAPTCTRDGTKTYTCTVCGNTKAEELLALGHSYDDGVVTTPPTCTQSGIKTYTCTVCGYTKTESLSALGHAYDDGVVTTAPTCTANGEKTYICILCNAKKYEDIPKIGNGSHNFENGICTVCNVKEYEYTVENGFATITRYNGNDTEITIPNAIDGYPVSSIGLWAFAYSNVKSVTIPDGITKICEGAFSSSPIESIFIPSSVEVIGDMAFCSCSYLKEIKISEANPNFCVIDNVLFNKDKTQLIVYPVGSTATNYTVPDGVRTIAIGAFAYANTLVSISLPSSVSNIGYGAFIYCVNLTQINLPYGIDAIPDQCFTYCLSLKNIDIPDTVTNIGTAAFGGTGITEVKIPASVAEIGENAFGIVAIQDTDGTYSIDLYPDFVIRGVKGSAAELYANENSLVFSELESVTFGDLDGDGIINSNDYAMLKSYVMCQSSLTEEQRMVADFDGDGAVDAFDVIALDVYIHKNNA